MIEEELGKHLQGRRSAPFDGDLMTAPAITVEGTLQPDGLTLRMEQRLSLPPGPVTVTVHAPAAPLGPPSGEENADTARPSLEFHWNKTRRRIRAAVKEYSGQMYADY